MMNSILSSQSEPTPKSSGSSASRSVDPARDEHPIVQQIHEAHPQSQAIEKLEKGATSLDAAHLDRPLSENLLWQLHDAYVRAQALAKNPHASAAPTEPPRGHVGAPQETAGATPPANAGRDSSVAEDDAALKAAIALHEQAAGEDGADRAHVIDDDQPSAPATTATVNALSPGASIVAKRRERRRVNALGAANGGPLAGAGGRVLPLYAMLHFHVESATSDRPLLIAELAWTDDLDGDILSGQEEEWGSGVRYVIESEGLTCPIEPLSLRERPLEEAEALRAQRVAELAAWTRSLTPAALQTVEALLAQLEALYPVRLSVLEHPASRWTIEATLEALYNAARTMPGSDQAEISYMEFIHRFVVEPDRQALVGMENSIASAAKVTPLFYRVKTPTDAFDVVGCHPQSFAERDVPYANALAELVVLRRVKHDQLEWGRRLQERGLLPT